MRRKFLFGKKYSWIPFILTFGLLILQPAFTADERIYQIVANRTHNQIEIDGKFNELGETLYPSSLGLYYGSYFNQLYDISLKKQLHSETINKYLLF